MELLVHFIVPLVALTIFGLELKKALPIALLAVVPDLDAFFYVHRSPSHSIVVALIAMAPFVLWTYRFKPKLLRYALLAFLALASHPILDVFGGYTPILWPLFGYSLWVQVQLGAYIGSSAGLLPSARLLMKPTTFEPFRTLDAPVFTGGGLVLSVVLLLPVLLRLSKSGLERLRELASR